MNNKQPPRPNLDPLTVTAGVLTVATGVISIYQGTRDS